MKNSASRSTSGDVPRGPHWFVPLQPLWRVERTFAWLGRNRRLRHDYEATVTSSQTFVHTAAVAFMLTRRPGQISRLRRQGVCSQALTAAEPRQLYPAVGSSWMPDLAALLLGCTIDRSAWQLGLGRPPGGLISMCDPTVRCLSIVTLVLAARLYPDREPGRSVSTIRVSGISAHGPPGPECARRSMTGIGVRTGCAWRLLPRLPPSVTGCGHSRDEWTSGSLGRRPRRVARTRSGPDGREPMVSSGISRRPIGAGCGHRGQRQPRL